MHPAFLLCTQQNFKMAKMPLSLFFLIKAFFFLRFPAAIFVCCFSLFLWFSCGIISGLLVRCERLGAMKVKISVLSVVVVVRQHTRYADGGASVGDVWNSYRSS